jgi:hypothetical protein
MPAFASLLEKEQTLNVCLQTQNRSGLVSLRTESVSAKHVRLYGTRWTPAYFIWDPLQLAAGLYGTRGKRKCPYGTRSFLSWSPMRRTAVLSSAVAAALGHEF